jgi:hypothetical protein
MGFEDPAEAKGTEVEVREVFRTVRDNILKDFFTLYQVYIRKESE